MITEKEFQEALKTVNEYILQLNNEVALKENKINKTLIPEWIIKQKNKSNLNHTHTRLFNCLVALQCEEYKYIEDVLAVVDPTKRFRNFGQTSVTALKELYFGDSNEADA